MIGRQFPAKTAHSSLVKGAAVFLLVIVDKRNAMHFNYEYKIKLFIKSYRSVNDAAI